MVPSITFAIYLRGQKKDCKSFAKILEDKIHTIDEFETLDEKGKADKYIMILGSGFACDQIIDADPSEAITAAAAEYSVKATWCYCWCEDEDYDDDYSLEQFLSNNSLSSHGEVNCLPDTYGKWGVKSDLSALEEFIDSMDVCDDDDEDAGIFAMLDALEAVDKYEQALRKRTKNRDSSESNYIGSHDFITRAAEAGDEKAAALLQAYWQAKKNLEENPEE